MAEETRNRREFLHQIFLTAAGAAAVGPIVFFEMDKAIARTPEGRDLPLGEVAEAEGGLLRGVPLTRPFSGDWFISAIYGPIAGGLTLVIQEGREGKPVRVDVGLRGDEVKAPAFTKYLEFFVMDGGGGVRDMPESLMLALGDLASMMEDNEFDPRLLEGLMTFEERWEAYPDFMGRAACELAPTSP